MAQHTRDELRDLVARLNAYAEADASGESLGANKTPTAFRWTPEMSAVFPVRLTMSQLTAMWLALHDAAEYTAVGALTEPTEEDEPSTPLNDIDKANGWVEWNGGSCPVGSKVWHQRKYRDGLVGGKTTPDMAGDYHWNHDGGNADIIAYRVLPS